MPGDCGENAVETGTLIVFGHLGRSIRRMVANQVP